MEPLDDTQRLQRKLFRGTLVAEYAGDVGGGGKKRVARTGVDASPVFRTSIDAGDDSRSGGNPSRRPPPHLRMTQFIYGQKDVYKEETTAYLEFAERLRAAKVREEQNLSEAARTIALDDYARSMKDRVEMRLAFADVVMTHLAAASASVETELVPTTSNDAGDGVLLRRLPEALEQYIADAKERHATRTKRPSLAGGKFTLSLARGIQRVPEEGLEDGSMPSSIAAFLASSPTTTTVSRRGSLSSPTASGVWNEHSSATGGETLQRHGSHHGTFGSSSPSAALERKQSWFEQLAASSDVSRSHAPTATAEGTSSEFLERHWLQAGVEAGLYEPVAAVEVPATTASPDDVSSSPTVPTPAPKPRTSSVTEVPSSSGVGESTETCTSVEDGGDCHDERNLDETEPKDGTRSATSTQKPTTVNAAEAVNPVATPLNLTDPSPSTLVGRTAAINRPRGDLPAGDGTNRLLCSTEASTPAPSAAAAAAVQQQQHLPQQYPRRDSVLPRVASVKLPPADTSPLTTAPSISRSNRTATAAALLTKQPTAAPASTAAAADAGTVDAADEASLRRRTSSIAGNAATFQWSSRKCNCESTFHAIKAKLFEDTKRALRVRFFSAFLGQLEALATEVVDWQCGVKVEVDRLMDIIVLLLHEREETEQEYANVSRQLQRIRRTFGGMLDNLDTEEEEQCDGDENAQSGRVERENDVNQPRGRLDMVGSADTLHDRTTGEGDAALGSDGERDELSGGGGNASLIQTTAGGQETLLDDEKQVERNPPPCPPTPSRPRQSSTRVTSPGRTQSQNSTDGEVARISSSRRLLSSCTPPAAAAGAVGQEALALSESQAEQPPFFVTGGSAVLSMSTEEVRGGDAPVAEGFSATNNHDDGDAERDVLQAAPTQISVNPEADRCQSLRRQAPRATSIRRGSLRQDWKKFIRQSVNPTITELVNHLLAVNQEYELQAMTSCDSYHHRMLALEAARMNRAAASSSSTHAHQRVSSQHLVPQQEGQIASTRGGTLDGNTETTASSPVLANAPLERLPSFSGWNASPLSHSSVMARVPEGLRLVSSRVVDAEVQTLRDDEFFLEHIDSVMLGGSSHSPALAKMAESVKFVERSPSMFARADDIARADAEIESQRQLTNAKLRSALRFIPCSLDAAHQIVSAPVSDDDGDDDDDIRYCDDDQSRRRAKALKKSSPDRPSPLGGRSPATPGGALYSDVQTCVRRVQEAIVAFCASSVEGRPRLWLPSDGKMIPVTAWNDSVSKHDDDLLGQMSILSTAIRTALQALDERAKHAAETVDNASMTAGRETELRGRLVETEELVQLLKQQNRELQSSQTQLEAKVSKLTAAAAQAKKGVKEAANALQLQRAEAQVAKLQKGQEDLRERLNALTDAVRDALSECCSRGSNDRLGAQLRRMWSGAATRRVEEGSTSEPAPVAAVSSSSSSMIVSPLADDLALRKALVLVKSEGYLHTVTHPDPELLRLNYETAKSAELVVNTLRMNGVDVPLAVMESVGRALDAFGAGGTLSAPVAPEGASKTSASMSPKVGTPSYLLLQDIAASDLSGSIAMQMKNISDAMHQARRDLPSQRRQSVRPFLAVIQRLLADAKDDVRIAVGTMEWYLKKKEKEKDLFAGEENATEFAEPSDDEEEEMDKKVAMEEGRVTTDMKKEAEAQDAAPLGQPGASADAESRERSEVVHAETTVVASDTANPDAQATQQQQQQQQFARERSEKSQKKKKTKNSRRRSGCDVDNDDDCDTPMVGLLRDFGRYRNAVDQACELLTEKRLAVVSESTLSAKLTEFAQEHHGPFSSRVRRNMRDVMGRMVAVIEGKPPLVGYSRDACEGTVPLQPRDSAIQATSNVEFAESHTQYAVEDYEPYEGDEAEICAAFDAFHGHVFHMGYYDPELDGFGEDLVGVVHASTGTDGCVKSGSNNEGAVGGGGGGDATVVDAVGCNMEKIPRTVASPLPSSSYPAVSSSGGGLPPTVPRAGAHVGTPSGSLAIGLPRMLLDSSLTLVPPIQRPTSVSEINNDGNAGGHHGATLSARAASSSREGAVTPVFRPPALLPQLVGLVGSAPGVTPATPLLAQQSARNNYPRKGDAVVAADLPPDAKARRASRSRTSTYAQTTVDSEVIHALYQRVPLNQVFLMAPAIARYLATLQEGDPANEELEVLTQRLDEIRRLFTFRRGQRQPELGHQLLDILSNVTERLHHIVVERQKLATSMLTKIRPSATLGAAKSTTVTSAGAAPSNKTAVALAAAASLLPPMSESSTSSCAHVPVQATVDVTSQGVMADGRGLGGAMGMYMDELLEEERARQSFVPLFPVLQHYLDELKAARECERQQQRQSLRGSGGGGLGGSFALDGFPPPNGGGGGGAVDPLATHRSSVGGGGGGGAANASISSVPPDALPFLRFRDSFVEGSTLPVPSIRELQLAEKGGNRQTSSDEKDGGDRDNMSTAGGGGGSAAPLHTARTSALPLPQRAIDLLQLEHTVVVPLRRAVFRFLNEPPFAPPPVRGASHPKQTFSTASLRRELASLSAVHQALQRYAELSSSYRRTLMRLVCLRVELRRWEARCEKVEKAGLAVIELHSRTYRFLTERPPRMNGRARREEQARQLADRSGRLKALVAAFGTRIRDEVARLEKIALSLRQQRAEQLLVFLRDAYYPTMHPPAATAHSTANKTATVIPPAIRDSVMHEASVVKTIAGLVGMVWGANSLWVGSGGGGAAGGTGGDDDPKSKSWFDRTLTPQGGTMSRAGRLGDSVVHFDADEASHLTALGALHGMQHVEITQQDLLNLKQHDFLEWSTRTVGDRTALSQHSLFATKKRGRLVGGGGGNLPSGVAQSFPLPTNAVLRPVHELEDPQSGGVRVQTWRSGLVFLDSAQQPGDEGLVAAPTSTGSPAPSPTALPDVAENDAVTSTSPPLPSESVAETAEQRLAAQANKLMRNRVALADTLRPRHGARPRGNGGTLHLLQLVRSPPAAGDPSASERGTTGVKSQQAHGDALGAKAGADASLPGPLLLSKTSHSSPPPEVSSNEFAGTFLLGTSNLRSPTAKTTSSPPVSSSMGGGGVGVSAVAARAAGGASSSWYAGSMPQRKPGAGVTLAPMHPSLE